MKRTKIADNFKHMHPLERKIMLLRAAQGSTRLEGMSKAADELGKTIDACTLQLENEKNNRPNVSRV